MPLKKKNKLSNDKIQEYCIERSNDLPPYPFGWYRILASRELISGEIKKVKCLDQDLIVYRDDKGKAIVTDAYCPHLGADLSDGKLESGCITCPFHGWCFDSSGKCISIPYIQKNETIPKQAQLKLWHVREVNHSIYIWYGDSDTSVSEEEKDEKEEKDEPFYELPLINTEIYKRYDGIVEHDVACHVQDIAENGSDTGHFASVHGKFMIKCLSFIFKHTWNASWEPRKDEKHLADLSVSTAFTIFGREISWTRVQVDSLQVGPQNVFLNFKTAFGDFFIIQSVLPIKLNLQLVTEVAYSSSHLPRIIAKVILFGTSIQFSRDVDIWNKKKFVSRPLIVKSDGPILKFRRWMKQFYPKSYTARALRSVEYNF